MTARQRSVWTDTLVYGAADAVARGAALFTLPLFTRVFTPAEYGVWAFLFAALLLVTSALSLGGDSAYGRLFFERDDRASRRAVSSTALWSVTSIAAAGAGLLWLAAPTLSAWAFADAAHAGAIRWAAAGIPPTLAGMVCAQALRNRFDAHHVAWTALLQTGLGMAGAVVGVLVLHMGVAGMFFGPTLAAALVLPVRILLVRDLVTGLPSFAVWRSLLAFGVPLVPMTVAYWVFASSDRLMVARLADLHAAGLYAVAASLVGAMAIATGAFGQAWSPHAAKRYEADRAAAARWIGRTFTGVVALFGSLVLVGSLFAREGVVLLAGYRYHEAALVVAPLALAGLAAATTQVTAVGLSLTKRTGRLALIAWGAALLNIVLNLLTIPRWGFLGAAWSTAVTYGTLSLAYHVASAPLYRIRYERRGLWALSLVTIATGVTVLFVDRSGLAIVAVKVAAALVGCLLLAVMARATPRARATRKDASAAPGTAQAVVR